MRPRIGTAWVLASLVLAAGALVGCGSSSQTPEPEHLTAQPVAPAPDAPDPEPEPEPDPEPEPEPDATVDVLPPATPVVGFDRPVRATWVHLFDPTLKTRAGIEAMVAELADAGVTTLIAQPIRRHDAYHRSDVLPRTPDPDVARGFDVLAELLAAAHAEGIAVHAWFSVAPTDHASYDDLTPPPGWVATTHGRSAPPEQRWVTRDVDGVWSDYLDVGLPAVQDHVVAVVREIVERYPVDGIHLDYVRYPSRQHGYHPDVLARYRAATGTSGTPAPDDPRFVAWRRDRGTELVAAVADALDATDPDVLLSAAVITWGDGPGGPDTPTFADTRAATDALQDWPGWVERGLVDAVLPMNYFRAHQPEQARWFERWLAFEARLAAEHDARIVPGIGAWLNAPDAVVAQARAAVERTDGAAIYSFQQPTEDGSRDVWAHLAEQAWPTG